MREDGFNTSLGEFLSHMSTDTLFTVLEVIRLERQSIVSIGVKKDIRIIIQGRSKG